MSIRCGAELIRPDDCRKKPETIVTALHCAALKLPFTQVTPVKSFGPEGPYRYSFDVWYDPKSLQEVSSGHTYIRVPLLRGWVFVIGPAVSWGWPWIGLGLLPERVETPHGPVVIRDRWCGTVRSKPADPSRDGLIDNVVGHVSMTALFDYAQKQGLSVSRWDETGYDAEPGDERTDTARHRPMDWLDRTVDLFDAQEAAYAGEYQQLRQLMAKHFLSGEIVGSFESVAKFAWTATRECASTRSKSRPLYGIGHGRSIADGVSHLVFQGTEAPCDVCGRVMKDGDERIYRRTPDSGRQEFVCRSCLPVEAPWHQIAQPIPCRPDGLARSSTKRDLAL